MHSFGEGRFINGVRLVYPMEKQAMRFFNILGNKFLSLAFSWLLGQPVKDTLCGTKVLRKSDYDLLPEIGITSVTLTPSVTLIYYLVPPSRH